MTGRYQITRPANGKGPDGEYGPVTRPWLITRDRLADGWRVPVMWCATRQEARDWIAQGNENALRGYLNAGL